MGVFTRLGEADVVAIARAFELGSVVAFEPIAEGTINSNFLVRTDRDRYFVRVNEGKAEVDVAWEARLVGALAARGFVTPPPLVARATDHEPRPYAALGDKWVSVFPWRPGRHLAPAEVTAARVAILGAALADLHRLGLELPPAWRRRSIYDDAHLATRFATFRATDDPQLAHAIVVCGEELARAAAARDVRAGATTGFIHGDLFRDNVLWDGEAISAVLDFEQASGGSLAYDLAVCINDWCWDDGFRFDLVQELIDGYRRVRPLPAGDALALPIEVRLAATRFTITRITDVYLARVDNPDKDFRAFLARVEAWRGPALGVLSSLL
ncbi:MAG: homoserine kinase [Proteobacteria bacterium]|nr:homoserine kinase [Pseudomonadota bacterium]